METKEVFARKILYHAAVARGVAIVLGRNLMAPYTSAYAFAQNLRAFSLTGDNECDIEITKIVQEIFDLRSVINFLAENEWSFYDKESGEIFESARKDLDNKAMQLDKIPEFLHKLLNETCEFLDEHEYDFPIKWCENPPKVLTKTVEVIFNEEKGYLGSDPELKKSKNEDDPLDEWRGSFCRHVLYFNGTRARKAYAIFAAKPV